MPPFPYLALINRFPFLLNFSRNNRFSPEQFSARANDSLNTQPLFSHIPAKHRSPGGRIVEHVIEELGFPAFKVSTMVA